jgi:hypothetical protein
MIYVIRKFFEWRLRCAAKRNLRLRKKFLSTAVKMARPTVLSGQNIFQLARTGRRAGRRVEQRRWRNRYVKPNTVEREVKRRFVIGRIFSRA